jgi:DNA-binding protein HU-beta
MKSGDKVTLVGFGTFSTSERAAREGRNPQSGDTINIPAKKVVKFKAGSKLVDSVQ